MAVPPEGGSSDRLLVMKKILVLGDIHANYPALKAVEKYVRPGKFHGIVNTGDFTVFSTFPNETIQWFRRRKKSVSILGNTDDRVLEILAGKELEKPRKEEKRVMYFWTCENLHAENVRYLKSLPKRQDFTVDDVRIGLFHGTADDEEELLFPRAPERRFRDLAKGSPYRVHIMGHSHVPYHRCIDGVHFVNPGSVGRMFDGDPRASFAILTVSSGKIEAYHFRIPYPVEEVIEGLRKNRLPDIYEKMYRKGKKLN